MTENLRDKDIDVLQAIQNGATNVSEIRERTTLTTREINYSLTEKSLEQLGLIKIDREEGREWTEHNGHEKNTWKAKQVRLTDQGIQALADYETTNQYENMTRRELIQQVKELEERQNRLENMFKDFRRKVMEQI